MAGSNILHLNYDYSKYWSKGGGTVLFEGLVEKTCYQDKFYYMIIPLFFVKVEIIFELWGEFEVEEGGRKKNHKIYFYAKL